MNYCIVVIVFAASEVVALLLFLPVNWLGPKSAPIFERKAALRGFVERLVLYTGLLHGYPQILIAFGALKLGSRLKSEQDNDDISNTYFLIGNMLSLFIAIVTTEIAQQLCM